MRVNSHDCPVGLGEGKKKDNVDPFPAIMGLGKECETQPLWTAVSAAHNNLQMERIETVGWRPNRRPDGLTQVVLFTRKTFG